MLFQPELSQSESYVQGPSPSAQGLEEEHLEIHITPVVSPSVFDPGTSTDTNTDTTTVSNTDTDESLVFAAVILGVPESAR